MPSALAAARHILIKRLAADWLILSAAFVTVVLTATLLASGPIYAEAVTLGALQQEIANAPTGDALVRIEQRTPPDLYDVSDDLVAQSAQEAFAATGADVLQRITAESFALPNQPLDGRVALASFEYFDDLAEHASLLAGTWPGPEASEVETVVLASTAEMLNLDLGDQLVVTTRRDDRFRRIVRIVGIYEIDDRADPFWLNDPLAIAGVTEPPGFRIYGPFVVHRQSMVDRLTRDRLMVSWRVFPRFENLTAQDLGHLRSHVVGLEDRINAAFVAAGGSDARRASEFAVRTGLPPMLAEMQRSLTVTRSAVLAILVQLAILAGYALVLAAGLLVGVRRTETHLLRSRGATSRQLLAISTLEGVLLTGPAALAAPWLASMALQLLNRIGPISSAGLAIEPRPTLDSYILSGLAALGAVFALSWPAFRSATRVLGSSSESRQKAESGFQRAGVDLALVALAVAAFWQLESLGPQIGATVRGRFGVDPLLVMTPALGLLAGGILALRVIPLVARTAERVASAGRASVVALSAWQVARRPVRYARSALLLIMAISIGFFAAAFSMTWAGSQRDQAEFQVGTDIRVSPNRRTNDSVADIYLPTTHEQLDSVTASMAVARKTSQLARSGTRGQFIFVDARRSNDIVHIREDLAPDFEELMSEMAARRPTMGSISLPGKPVRIGLTLGASENWPQPPDDLAPPLLRAGFDLRVSAIVQDGDGLLHRVVLGSIPINGGPTLLIGQLTHTFSDGTVAVPRFPLALVDIEIFSPFPTERAHEPTVTLTGIHVHDGETGWRRAQADLDPSHWELSRSEAARVVQHASIEFSPDQPPNTLVLSVNTGLWLRGAAPPMYFSVRPAGTRLPEKLPIVVSGSLLESNAMEVGESLRLRNLDMPNDDAEIIGTLAAFPTVDSRSAEAILIDLPTFQMMAYGPGGAPGPVSEFWMSSTGENDSAVEAELLGPKFESVHVLGTESRTAALTTDPIALGTIGALSLGFVAATVFATVGFAVTATVSARERIREFALFRALGLSSKQLAGWLSLEQGALVALSVALGTVVGFLLTALFLPLVSLTQAGASAEPEVIVVFPWGTVLQLELAVLTLLGVMVLVMTLLLRRLGLGSLLRLGDE